MRVSVKGTAWRPPDHVSARTNFQSPRHATSTCPTRFVFTRLPGIQRAKSSLAFETPSSPRAAALRESLSAYAPPISRADGQTGRRLHRGLSPAVSIDQVETRHNPTIGQWDHHQGVRPRLLCARGHAHCPTCGGASRAQTPRIVMSAGHAGGHSVSGAGPGGAYPQGRKFADLFDKLNAQGYSRVQVDGVVSLTVAEAEAGKARHRGGGGPSHRQGAAKRRSAD